MDLTRLFSRRARASLNDMAMSKLITERRGYGYCKEARAFRLTGESGNVETFSIARVSPIFNFS